MGEVYQAEQTSLQTPAAVKLLNEDISEDRDHVTRFFNEARVVSKIRHAGIVKIFDSGFYKGRAYLVMELLEGESLGHRIEKRAQLPIGEAADIAAQIASILDATHRQGVIHRDLKPDNIFMVRDDERASGERVKILDFGIAKLTGGTLASNSPKTSGTMGTPTYMAPEQWGDSSAVDWRADAYSLGCVAYELVTGRPPFICNSIPEAYAKHLTEVPVRASTLRPDSPHDLDMVLAKLLAKTPIERATMSEASASFAAIAGRRPSAPVAVVTPPSQFAAVTPPPTLTTISGSTAELRMKPPAKRSRGALYGGIGAAAVVIGLLVVVMTRSHDDDKPAPAAEPAPAPGATPTPPPAAAPTPPRAAAPATPSAPAPTPAPAAEPTPTPASAPTPPPPPPPTPTPTAKTTPHDLAKHHATPPPHVAPTPKAGSAATPPPKKPDPIDMGGRL